MKFGRNFVCDRAQGQKKHTPNHSRCCLFITTDAYNVTQDPGQQ